MVSNLSQEPSDTENKLCKSTKFQASHITKYLGINKSKLDPQATPPNIYPH